jgi:hypothetical protein
MPAESISRIPGATGDHPAIARFLDEARAAAKVRGLLAEHHIETLETVLANACFAASNDPACVDFWDHVVAIIRRRDRTVKERLMEIGRTGELLDERRRGRMN